MQAILTPPPGLLYGADKRCGRVVLVNWIVVMHVSLHQESGEQPAILGDTHLQGEEDDRDIAYGLANWCIKLRAVA